MSEGEKKTRSDVNEDKRHVHSVYVSIYLEATRLVWTADDDDAMMMMIRGKLVFPVYSPSLELIWLSLALARGS